MKIEQKVIKLLTAETEKDVYDAIATLTDNQKDIMIASLVRLLKEMHAGINSLEQIYKE